MTNDTRQMYVPLKLSQCLHTRYHQKITCVYVYGSTIDLM